MNTEREESESKFFETITWLIVILAIIGLLLAIFSRVLTRHRIVALEDRLRKLKHEHLSKHELKKKLDKKVNQFFFATRVFLSAIFIAVNISIYIYLNRFDWGNRLQIMLACNQTLFILILIYLFIRFASRKECTDIIRWIHLTIKQAVYKNYPQLEEEIKQLEKEIDEITKELETLNTKVID